MKEDPSDNQLSLLLSEWQAAPGIRPDFENEVWASIEARRTRKLFRWLEWFGSPSFLSPQYAAAYMAAALIAGGIAGGIYNSGKTHPAHADMAGKYLDLIDPLAAADHRQ